MMISTLLLASLCAPGIEAPVLETLTASAQEVSLTWSAPDNLVRGVEFPVALKITAPKDSTIPGAWLGPEGFTVNGEAVGQSRPDVPQEYSLTCTLEFDLAPFLAEHLPQAESFSLGVVGSEVTKEVRLLTPAPEGLDFMSMDASKLGDYGVLLHTTSGDMLVGFWPETAPNHVRNYLDLSYMGFYDGTLFHRCIPGFMIQGGDPTSKDPKTDPRKLGMGNGPRKVDAEFSDRPHERGTLSAARLGNDVNSATSQFFICHQRAASLDRQYSAFGQLVFGEEVIDAIVNQPKALDIAGRDPRTGQPRRVPSDRPMVPQVIERATVVLLPK